MNGEGDLLNVYPLRIRSMHGNFNGCIEQNRVACLQRIEKNIFILYLLGLLRFYQFIRGGKRLGIPIINANRLLAFNARHLFEDAVPFNNTPIFID